VGTVFLSKFPVGRSFFRKKIIKNKKKRAAASLIGKKMARKNVKSLREHDGKREESLWQR